MSVLAGLQYSCPRPLEMKKGTEQWKGVEEYGYLTEDRPIPRFTSKLPWVKLSQRAFVTGTNVHNWRIFRQYYEATLRLNEKIASGEVKLKEGEAFSVTQEMADFAKLLTDFTGRAKLGKVSGLAPVLSAFFFAPRYKLGRILTPRHLFSHNPRVRLEAWKDLSMFVGTTGGIILLGSTLGLWELEKDPRSADFMKIRIGNTRVDPWGGYQQIAVFATRLFAKTGISSITGQEYESKFFDSVSRFLRGSASPLASLAVDLYTGSTFIGEKVNLKDLKQWVRRVAPIVMMDIYEAFKDKGIKGVGLAIPAWFGGGVQTYTGDWVENQKKLGLPKYMENSLFGITEPVYDVKDFWADTAKNFTGVDPKSLTKEKGYPDYIRTMAEALIFREELAQFPNRVLTRIDIEKLPEYRRIWAERQKLLDVGKEASFVNEKGDTLRGEDAVDAFEKAFPDWEMGNVSQKDYSLLLKYHSTNEEGKKKILEEHPELKRNPRLEQLRKNPDGNAKLAVFGQAKVYTQEAYDKAIQYANQWDFPEASFSEYMPNKGVAASYFKYLEAEDEFGANSPEAKLIRVQNPNLSNFLKLAVLKDNAKALELTIKNKDYQKLYASFADKDSPQYQANEETRKEVRKRFNLGWSVLHPETLKEMSMIEAYKKNASDKQAQSWAEYEGIKESFGKDYADVYAIANPKFLDWALNVQLLGDDPRLENNQHSILKVLMAKMDKSDPEYKVMEEAIDAWRKGFPDRLIPQYRVFANISEEGYEQEWFLAENKAFYDAAIKYLGLQPIDFRQIPTRKQVMEGAK